MNYMEEVKNNLTLILLGIAIGRNQRIRFRISFENTYQGKSLVIEDFQENEDSVFRKWMIINKHEKELIEQGIFTKTLQLDLAEEVFRLLKKKSL